jgi:hypothetical protein
VGEKRGERSERQVLMTRDTVESVESGGLALQSLPGSELHRKSYDCWARKIKRHPRATPEYRYAAHTPHSRFLVVGNRREHEERSRQTTGKVDGEYPDP